MSGLPVYNNAGEPTTLERFVQDSIDWLTNCFTHPLRGTCLDYWLLNPNELKAAVALGSAHDRLEKDVSVEGDVDSGQDEDDGLLPLSPGVSPLPREETPIMRKLAPPGHRPTNAHLEGSPFHVVQPLGPRTSHSAAPGYQIPSAAKSGLSKAFSTRPLQGDNFSDLAKDAPISYQTLQGNGMLDADGTLNKWTGSANVGPFAKLAREAPVAYGRLQGNKILNSDGTRTKKWESEKRVPNVLGLRRKDKEENEAGLNNGRVMLRRELDDEDFA